jgi:hypothetical protein
MMMMMMMMAVIVFLYEANAQCQIHINREEKILTCFGKNTPFSRLKSISIDEITSTKFNNLLLVSLCIEDTQLWFKI